MRRPVLALVIVSALSILASAAVYADSMAGQNSPGWLKATMEGVAPSMIPADAQKEMGVTLDQLKMDMGPTSLTSSDGQGGTEYYYRVEGISAGGGLTGVEQYYDVDSSGKVLKVITAAG